ncbi:hypothetical protein [Cyanobium sp. NIES-981]|uniref:hypothetical protein n=1 Tax=Cyanobium sp. NIES-981 TaxID=1851505 RepID=UPI0007DD7D0F
MAPDSVSFRITRNTEDLAQTIHALSQRLVVMEQRLQALEVQLNSRIKQDSEPDIREVSSLDNVERLLYDCRALLGLDEAVQESGDDASGAEVETDLRSPSVPFQQAA